MLSSVDWSWKKVVGLGALAFLGAKYCIFFVKPDEAAIVYDRRVGVSGAVRRQGIHFNLPVVQFPIFFQIRPMVWNFTTEGQCSDNTYVRIGVKLHYQPVVDELPKIFTTHGIYYAVRVLTQLSHEIAKESIGKFDGRNLPTKEEMSIHLQKHFNLRLKDHHIRIRLVEIDQLKVT